MPKFLGLFEPSSSLVSEVGRNSPNTIFVSLGRSDLVELYRGFKVGAHVQPLDLVRPVGSD